MIRPAVCVCLLLQTLSYLPLATRSQEVFSSLPYVSGKWEWEFQFFYHTQSSEKVANYTFRPPKSTFRFDPQQVQSADNKTMILIFEPDVSQSVFTKIVVNITVIRESAFFAWTDMTLFYTFTNYLPNMNTTVEPLTRLIEAHSEQKFYTRVDEVYECVSSIPIPFGTNATIFFKNMIFQAFDAKEFISEDRSREVCPRDFKSNVPITALTGASLLFLVVIGLSGYGINFWLAHRKRKQN